MKAVPLAAALAAALAGAAAEAQPMLPSPAREVGFDQKTGAKVPLTAVFRDEEGRSVPLATYFGKRPVVLSLAYYECPMLCGIALEGLARSLKGFSLEPGKDFEVVTISFNPVEGPRLAALKKEKLVDFYGRPGGREAWHFLTGEDAEIRKVTEAVGFRYRWDEDRKQYAHAAGIVVLTPDGTVSRYFFGVEYAPKELRLGLSEASAGKVGGLTAQLLLLCYQYDAALGKYTPSVLLAIRVAAVLTVAALATLILVLLRRERRRRDPIDAAGVHS